MFNVKEISSYSEDYPKVKDNYKQVFHHKQLIK